jgi:hypothetical protein
MDSQSQPQTAANVSPMQTLAFILLTELDKDIIFRGGVLVTEDGCLTFNDTEGVLVYDS